MRLPRRQLQLEPRDLKGTEAATRAACLTGLATFGEAFYPGWEAAAFHVLLAEKLEDCLRRKIKRLIINVPPQHGKSRETSVIFPAWALTKFPTLRFFQAGHTGDLSKGFSREARDLVQSDRYRHFFPDLINPKVNREGYWRTKLGGYYFATSVGGGTGVPADVLLIDDPHRDRAEANSPAHRQRVWDWFTSTAMTRLAPDGIVIIIQTRWHRDDLSGRLQDPKRIRELEEAGFSDMKFEVLSLEAICENPAKDALGRQMGEALWPEVRPVPWLKAQKIIIGNYEWNSLYQQRPNPPGGNIVDVTNISVIPRSAVPKEVLLNRGWDLAVSDKTLGDYSVGAYGGCDKEGNFYLVHIDRGRRLWPEQKKTLYKYVERECLVEGGNRRVGIEAIGAWEVAVSNIRDDFKGKIVVKTFKPTVDKLTRALPWMAKVDAKMFYVVEGAWNQDFFDELESFPNGEHDDQIDAVTVCYELFARKGTAVFA